MNSVLCKVYIADCSVDGGVYCFDLTKNGTLIQKQFVGIENPMFLNIEGDKMHIVLRSVSEFDGDSATVTYNIDSDGMLTGPSEAISTNGKIACHLCSFKGNVYTANYISGSVCREGEDAVVHTGYGSWPDRQDKAHCHFISPTFDNKDLLAVDLGNDTIYTYDDQLNELYTAKVPCGCGCRHLAYSKNGRYVYCINELSSSVSVFEYDDGRLTLLETYDTLPYDFDGQNTAAAIRVVGNKLYVSNRGYDAITVFELFGADIKKLYSVKSGGSSPRDFDLYKDFLVCTNESGEITVFKVTKERLELVNNDIKLTHPLCVVFK